LRKNLGRITSKDTSLALLITLTLLLSTLSVTIYVPLVQAQETVVRVFPEIIELGPENVIGQNFTIAVIIENVTDLAGVDIQIRWNTTYFQYVSHEQTMPVESYPDPIPPSPYPGILHNPPLPLKDEVNETAGTYWAGFATLGGPSFDGSGTVFIMTFQVIDQPSLGEEDVTLSIQFTSTDLPDSGASPIPHVAIDGTVIIHAPLFEYPPLPLLKIMPETIEDIPMCNNFTIDVYLMGDNGTDLDQIWDIGGIDVVVNFNTTLLEAVATTIDPDGWFSSFWPSIYVTADEINNTAGTVHIAFIGFGVNHTAPSGQGKLFTVTLSRRRILLRVLRLR